MSLNIGVVGATGMVGEAFMNLLERRKFPIKSLKPFASENSKGKKLKVQDKEWEVETLQEGCFAGLDVVFFSSGDEISKEWAPKAVTAGAFAIDNSAAFRMDPDTPLVVPEVNGHMLPNKAQPSIIANPNCSTIQLVVALKAFKDFEIKSVKVSTYQAVSGSGKAGKEELLNQTKEFLEHQTTKTAPETYPHPIAFNALPHIGGFSQDGFCSEEHKIMRETKKILEIDVPVSAFTVRIPTLNTHSEAVWVTTEKAASKTEVLTALEKIPGLKLIPQTEPENYPHAHSADQTEPVYVGRVHRDLSDPNTWMFWVVADNIWKGAALNGLQIAEQIFDI